MASAKISASHTTSSKRHLSVHDHHNQQLLLNTNELNVEHNRGRSERASSLALPHSSLLDFYDKQQEQCNSATLMPTNVNVVVRRHSSHYYPMLEQQEQLQYQHNQQALTQPRLMLPQQLPSHEQAHQQQFNQNELQKYSFSTTLQQVYPVKPESIFDASTNFNSLRDNKQSPPQSYGQQRNQKFSHDSRFFSNDRDPYSMYVMQKQQLHQQQKQSQPDQQELRFLPAKETFLASKPSKINDEDRANYPNVSLNSTTLGHGIAVIGNVNAIAGTPPPIPKRTFRAHKSGASNMESSGNGGLSASNDIGSAWMPRNETGGEGKSNVSVSITASPVASAKQTPRKDKQQQSQAASAKRQQSKGIAELTGTAFIYPQPIKGGSECGPALHEGEGEYYLSTTAATMLDDNKSDGCNNNASGFLGSSGSAEESRAFYTDSGLDAGGISDDDRMSLENSVFDESLTSTPVKVAAAQAASQSAGAASVSAGAGKLANVNYPARSLVSVLAASELSTAAKRSNRSSSSTVDSAITTSSGYGSSSHSERLASTSTSADFRSRFSSVDTQSSLDSCLTEKISDSSLNKESFKLQSDDDQLQTEFSVDNSNANLCQLQILFNQQPTSNNNNSLAACKLPTVPQRRSHGNAKTLAAPTGSRILSNVPSGDSQHSLNSKSSSTVSASTSTSSTGSAISATSPCSSGTSMTAKTAAAAIHDAIGADVKKRPVPPLPPVRNQTSMESNENPALSQTNSLAPNTAATTVSRPLHALRNKWHKQKPPPIVYPITHQRQDSTLSSDSFSLTSSPGYNSRNVTMDVPLLQNASGINKTGPGMNMRHQDSIDSFNMTASRYGNTAVVPPTRNKLSYRQDSTISSDSFSQTSSPGYNTKVMEAPLLPASLSVKRLCGVPAPIVYKQKLQNETIEELDHPVPLSPLTKCVSTPASLQTIVRFQNGAPNTMSFQHRIINRRKSSNPYVTNGRLKFRLFQILLNALALLAIAGGLAAYFNAYPTIRFVNKTIINTIHVENISKSGMNPAPGTCLPIIVKFCQGPQIPYNFTVFPNYIGHFGQLETQVDLDAYEALVDVRCYELVSLFLCTLFVPKCGSTGATVPPCKTLCTETMRRCGFFFDVFGLSLPEYLNCKLFKDFESPEDCVGLEQVRDVMIASTNPKCDGFQCDQNRCIPREYVCDGHLDCMDQADEASCDRCGKDEIYCGNYRCVSARHICDGVFDCPYGQDERNCIRLSERNGDLGKGVLEVFRINSREWSPACVKNWDRAVSPSVICTMLGYSSVNATSVVTQKTHRPLLTPENISTDIWKLYAKKRSTLMQDFSNCKPEEDYPIAELTCTNYECGKVKRVHQKRSKRIIGGSPSNPGSWPFLAAILGGPEKIFYCAGVLISDQWVLTASHCVGNHTVIDLEDWTIQLGVTRRNSFTYSGQKVKVKTVIPHPQYNTAIAHDNDIALFQLSSRVAFHEHLLPVCLPPSAPEPDLNCTVIGWGKREDKDPKSTYEPIINEVEVPIISRQICDEWLDNLTVSDGMICAGYAEGGKDACQGDSGGPLLCPYPGEKDRWYVGGIVSWGIMCAHPKLPGVYANVIKYVPWILEQMQKYSRPLSEEKFSKYDAHPGGPDILSNISTGPTRHKNTHSSNSNNNNNKNLNRSPMDIDYYNSMEKN